MNGNWHRGHAIPANATMDQRIAWHLEHALRCACREIPEPLRREIAARMSPRIGVAPEPSRS